MRAQYELTKRFSAEGSICRYIARDPERAMAFLQAWTTDSNPHVRRLVSKGTRLRLPWAPRVAWLDENPERRLLVEHALRSAVKRGDNDALRLLGYGQTPQVSVEAVAFTPPSRSPPTRRECRGRGATPLT